MRDQIRPLSAVEIDLVSGGSVIYARAFNWVGAVLAVKDLGKYAYQAGYWVGEHS